MIGIYVLDRWELMDLTSVGMVRRYNRSPGYLGVKSIYLYYNNNI